MTILYHVNKTVSHLSCDFSSKAWSWETKEMLDSILLVASFEIAMNIPLDSSLGAQHHQLFYVFAFLNLFPVKKMWGWGMNNCFFKSFKSMDILENGSSSKRLIWIFISNQHYFCVLILTLHTFHLDIFEKASTHKTHMCIFIPTN